MRETCDTSFRIWPVTSIRKLSRSLALQIDSLSNSSRSSASSASSLWSSSSLRSHSRSARMSAWSTQSNRLRMRRRRMCSLATSLASCSSRTRLRRCSYGARSLNLLSTCEWTCKIGLPLSSLPSRLRQNANNSSAVSWHRRSKIRAIQLKHRNSTSVPMLTHLLRFVTSASMLRSTTPNAMQVSPVPQSRWEVCLVA